MNIYPCNITQSSLQGLDWYLVLGKVRNERQKVAVSVGLYPVTQMQGCKMLCPKRLLYHFRSVLLIQQNSRREAACGVRAMAFSEGCFSM